MLPHVYTRYGKTETSVRVCRVERPEAEIIPRSQQTDIAALLRSLPRSRTGAVTPQIHSTRTPRSHRRSNMANQQTHDRRCLLAPSTASSHVDTFIQHTLGTSSDPYIVAIVSTKPPKTTAHQAQIYTQHVRYRREHGIYYTSRDTLLIRPPDMNNR